MAVVLLGAMAAFAYFFVEIEEEEADESTQEVELGATVDDSDRFQRHAEQPGWLWDTVNEEWVPDDSQA